MPLALALALALAWNEAGKKSVSGGQLDFVWLPARVAHESMSALSTCGEPDEIKDNTHPNNITAPLLALTRSPGLDLPSGKCRTLASIRTRADCRRPTGATPRITAGVADGAAVAAAIREVGLAREAVPHPELLRVLAQQPATARPNTQGQGQQSRDRTSRDRVNNRETEHPGTGLGGHGHGHGPRICKKEAKIPLRRRRREAESCVQKGKQTCGG